MRMKKNAIEVFEVFQMFLIFSLINIPDASSFEGFLRAEIQEEQLPGTFVLSVPVETGIQQKFSGKERSRIEYELLLSHDTRYFKLNKASGSLTTSLRLDRELLCSDPQVEKCCNSRNLNSEQCILLIQLKANKDGVFFHFVEVSVEIKDINDNAPNFIHSVQSLEVAENVQPGTVVHFFNVVDTDSTVNSIKQVRLEISKPADGVNVFHVEHVKRGINLIATKALDRETVPEYNMKIIAIDGGTPAKTGTTSLTVSISDVNDNSPIWITKSFKTFVPEDLQVNSLIFKLEASDSDSGANGRIYYEFNSRTQGYLDGLDKFKIDSTSGEIRLRGTLDYEQQRQYELHVIAQDFGKAKINSATATVTINIKDVNDSPPLIKVIYLMDEKTITVAENEAPGKTIATIFVDDPDTGSGGKVTCNLNSEVFQLENIKQNLRGRQGYTLVTKTSFDRETVETYRAIIKCFDHGTPQIRNSKVLTISIKDVNDNHPKFSKDIFEVKYPENNPSGQIICKINATDADKDRNGQLKFWLSDEARNWVSINEDTGLLYSATSFDRESLSAYRFLVFVKDLGNPQFTVSATVNINVQDTNDHEPRFTDIYFFTVTENSQPGTLVGTIRADDQDLDNNGKVFYQLLTGSREFKLNGDTGELVIRSSGLDREKKSNYELEIRAQDRGQPPKFSNTRVHINVLDVNDHAPRFIFPNKEHNYVNVSCNELPNQVITRVQANDSDSDENAKIFYSIVTSSENKGLPTESSEALNSNPSETPGPLFDIDLQSGQLLLLRPFLHCGAPYEERIVLNATDQGQPPRSSTAILFIRILDQQPNRRSDMKSRARYHLSAIVGLVVATIVLIFLLCIVLLLMKNRFSQEKKYPTEHRQPEITKLTTKREVEGTSARELYTTPNYYYTCDAEVYDFMDAKTQEEAENNRTQGRLYMSEHHPSCHTIAGDRPYQTLNRVIDGGGSSSVVLSRGPPPYSNYSQGTGEDHLAGKYTFICPQSDDEPRAEEKLDDFDSKNISSVFSPLVEGHPQRMSGVTLLNRKASTGCIIPQDFKNTMRIRTNSSGEVMQENMEESLSMTHLSRSGTLPNGHPKLKNPYCTVSFV